MKPKYEIIADIKDTRTEFSIGKLLQIVATCANVQGVITCPGLGVLLMRQSNTTCEKPYFIPHLNEVLNGLRNGNVHCLYYFKESFMLANGNSNKLIEITFESQLPDTVGAYKESNPHACQLKNLQDFKDILFVSTLTNLKALGTTNFFRVMKDTYVKGEIIIKPLLKGSDIGFCLFLTVDEDYRGVVSLLPSASEFFKSGKLILEQFDKENVIHFRAETEIKDYRNNSSPIVIRCKLETLTEDNNTDNHPTAIPVEYNEGMETEEGFQKAIEAVTAGYERVLKTEHTSGIPDSLPALKQDVKGF